MPLPDDELPDLVEPTAFAAAFSGQAMPGEDADTFVQRRKKLVDLGALGPSRLPGSERERAAMADDAQRVQRGLANDAEQAARQQQQDQQRSAALAQREQAAVAKQQATAAAKAARDNEAAKVKQWREAGVVTRTNAENKQEPDTHEDGRVKYKPDMVGDPYLHENGRYVRDFRDDGGAVRPVDLEENGDLHTDAQSGEKYYKGAGGLRVNLGPDDHWQQRETAKEELAALKNGQSVAAVELDQHQLALAPVKAAWSEQQSKTRQVREKLATMEANVKATGDKAAEDALKMQQSIWEGMKPEYDRAKAEYETLSARETELKSGILDGRKKALSVSANLDKLKARSWGRKPTDAPSAQDRANSVLEAAQAELTEAQDAARTLSATAKVAGAAFAGGATAGQVGKLKGAGDEANAAVSARIREAGAKVQHLGGLTAQLKKTEEQAESIGAPVQKAVGAIMVESQKVMRDMMDGTISREAGTKRLAGLQKAADAAQAQLKKLYDTRKGIVEQIATYDDPKTWETSPDRGLALAAVDKQIAESQQIGGSAVDGAHAALTKAQDAGIATLVEGKPIAEQLATLKAELTRRQAKTPRADYAAQIAMLDAGAKANATGEEAKAAFAKTVTDLVAQRDAESVTGYANWGDGVLAAAGHVWSEQQNNAANVLADKNTGIIAKTLHTLGGAAGASLGGLSTIVMGKTIADITRTEHAKEARQLIGNLDAAGAEKVLRSLPALDAQWKKDGSVLTPEQIAAAKAEGDAGVFSPGAEGSFRFAGGGKANGALLALNRTLYGAEKVIKELEAEKAGAIGDVAASALANALPFASSGGIEIDENDSQQVAQRAFLRVKLHEAIQKHAPGLTLTGSALGSLAGFMTAAGVARGAAGKLGLGAKAGTIGTGAIMGADMSLKENEGKIGFLNRLADTAFKGSTLMLSERIGDAFGGKLQGMLASVQRIPAGAGRFLGRAVGGAAGEFTSDLAQNAMEGKNALAEWQQSLAVNSGLGIGMAIVGAIADGKARKIGGKPLAPNYEGAMNAHTDAMAALDKAQQAGDVAQITIATDTLKQTQAHLDLATTQLTAVSDRTRSAIGAALGMESKALGVAIAENEVLATAGVAIGQEVRDVYLAGGREAAALGAATRETDFGGAEGGPLALIVVDQHVGAAVARDLAGVADGSVTLTAPKIDVLARLGIVEQQEDGSIFITDDAVALLPPSMRAAIERNDAKFRVSVTPGNDGKIISGLLAQGRSLIGSRVGGVTKAQAAKVAQAVASSGVNTPSTASQSPAWDVVVTSETTGGTATNKWRIEAPTAQEAEATATARETRQGGKVTSAKATQISSPGGNTAGNGGSQGRDVLMDPTREPVANPGSGSISQPSSGGPVMGVAGVGPGAAAAGVQESGVRSQKPKAEKPAPTLPERQTITPSENTPIGKNAAGEFLYEMADGSIYRMRLDQPNTKPNGYPDFGGDLVQVTETKPEKPKNPKAEKPAQKSRLDVIRETFGKMLAGEGMAKSFGALGVEIQKGADLGGRRWLTIDWAVKPDGQLRLRLFYNVDATLAKLLSDMPKSATDADVVALIESSLREELIHFAQIKALHLQFTAERKAGLSRGSFDGFLKAHYLKLFNLLNATADGKKQLAAMRLMYGKKNISSDWHWMMEGTRQLIQLSQDGKTSETVTEWLRKHFAAALDVLRKLAGNPAAQSKHLAQTIKDVEAVLAGLEASAAEITNEKTTANSTSQKSVLGVPQAQAPVQLQGAVDPAQSIANPDGIADVAPPAVAADVASKAAFQKSVAETNAQAKKPALTGIDAELDAAADALAEGLFDSPVEADPESPAQKVLDEYANDLTGENSLDASPAQGGAAIPPQKLRAFVAAADVMVRRGQSTTAEVVAALQALGEKEGRDLGKYSAGMLAAIRIAESVPEAKVKVLMDIAAGLSNAGIDTPEKIAHEFKVFSLRTGSDLLPFAQPIWDAMGMVQPALHGEHDWAAVMRSVPNPVLKKRADLDLSSDNEPKNSVRDSERVAKAQTSGLNLDVEGTRRWLRGDDNALSDAMNSLDASPAHGEHAQDYHTVIPAEKGVQLVGFATAMLKAGKRSPEAVAEYLEDKFKGKARAYTDAIFTMMKAFGGEQSSPDWAAVYGKRDGNKSPAEAAKPEAAAGNEAETSEVSNDTAPTSTVRRAADAINARLKTGAKMSWQELFDIADTAFGGTQAEGKYTVKDAYDAMELAVNLWISGKVEFRPQASTEAAVNVVRNFENHFLPQLPTQTKRTAEQDAMQQFSTPPHLAFLANWVANVKSGDVMLEPSAGIGGIAVFAKNAGAKVLANELSARRREYLAEMGFDTVTGENAEQLHAIYEPKIASGEIQRPTVVVMNPPFSNAAKSGKTGKTIIGAQHVEEGLKLLPEGGRLVAIVGEGMAMDAPTFRAWWARIQREYNVRANVWMNGKNYVKYGTSFDNRLLVIDKTGPTTTPPINIRVDDLKELPKLLEGVRNDRTEPTSVEPGISRPTATSQRPAVGDSSRTSADDAAAPAGDAGARGERPGGTRSDSSGSTQSGVDAGKTGGKSGPAGVDGGNTRGSRANGTEPSDTGSDSGLAVGTKSGEKKVDTENEDDVFANYTPSKVSIAGAKAHPAKLVESAAMASVPSPDPTYRPSLPSEVITEGKLSEAQLENVIYAGQAHEQKMEDGSRRGYFIGDGTGVGKGRQIAGIILDNLRKGRKRAVWVSKSTGLMEDAKRDAADIGIDPKTIRPLRKLKKTQSVDGDGVIFTSYDTLKGGHEGILGNVEDWWNGITGKEPNSRIQQLVKWLGKDFDGVIVFDEAHMAGNAIPVKGKRGMKAASKNGIAVVDLQRALPNARVVYVSATGATEIENLSYADRLGVWGPGTPFSDKKAFFNKIGAGGISAMEIVSRDLKAMGLYLARSISYKGVEFGRLTQTLTTEQQNIYDEIASGWQVVLSTLDDTMANSGANNSPSARSSALSAFWGAQQRFFNQIVTAMSMPALLGDMRKQLDAGNSLVLQLVNTNEASQDREIAKRQTEKGDGEETNLEDMDLSPRDILLQYISTNYPTAKYEEVQDPNDPDSTIWKPAMTADGKPIQDPAAVRARDGLLDKLSVLKIPENPIEQIMNAFGSENVAEVTGRSQRVVQQKQKDGTRKVQIERRSENHRQADAKDFQDGKKRVLIFSAAGGTGFSFHADRRAKNQEKRVHYVVQAGWRADAALQGPGRSHRTNQAHEPFFQLLETNIPGHKRFIATIARRLGQMGAVTQGDRKGAGGGLFSEADNLEGQYADDAIKRLIYDLFNNRAGGLTMQDFAADFGFIRTSVNQKTGDREVVNTLVDSKTGGLNESKVPTVPIFLNRILSTPLARQFAYFDLFTDRMAARIERAKGDGTYDPGTQLYKAARLEKKTDEAVYTHPGTAATTRIVQLDAINPVSFSNVDQIATGAKVIKWVKNKRSGRVYAVKEGMARTDEETGAILPTYRRLGTRDATTVPQDSIATDGPIENYEALTEEQAREAWAAEIEAAPKETTEKVNFLVGVMLPIWDRTQLPNPKIYRLTTTDDESMLGVLVPPKEVAGLRARLGAKNTMKAADAFSLVIESNGTLTLANGWKIRRSYVSGDYRAELSGMDWQQAQDFTQRLGGFMERIQYNSRYFIPSEKVMGAVMKVSPITEVNGQSVNGGNSLDASPAHDLARESAPFYSKLTRTVQGLAQAVMTVAQARAAVTQGAKKDEVAMSGILTDPLSPIVGKADGEKVTREELIGFALERQATVEDVVLGDSYANQAELSGYRRRMEAGDGLSDAEQRRYGRLSQHDDDGGDNTHFAQYQLPGADEGSYREMFVTWPEIRGAPEKVSQAQAMEVLKSGGEVTAHAVGEIYTGDEYEVLNTEDLANFPITGEERYHFYSGHYSEMKGWQDGHGQYSDIINPIVRIRRNIRTDAEGRRTYFIEEMQGPNPDGQSKMPPEIRKRIYEIGMKRALRDAAEEGADAIGWTTGEQQAERYDLSKQVESIGWDTSVNYPDVRIVFVRFNKNTATVDVDPNGIITETNTVQFKGAKLEDVVGKEIAKKILEEAKGELSGEGLKVGGEGLKRLYDATLPTIARDLAKKFGGVVRLKNSQSPIADSQLGHSMPIPDGLRKQQIEDGNALYASPAHDVNAEYLGYEKPNILRDEADEEAAFQRLRDRRDAENMNLATDRAQVEEERDSSLEKPVNPLSGRTVGSDAADIWASVTKGRKDLVDRSAPGAADAITDSEISAAMKRAALRELLKGMSDEIDTHLGKEDRKSFVAELLPTAARLNAVGYDSMSNPVFEQFEMRAGTLGEKVAAKQAKSTGDVWIGRDGEALRIGAYLEDQKAYQLHRTMPASRQRAIYQDFKGRYPKVAHYLERWIAPDKADSRIVDARGTVLPDFNRHALRQFFGDVSPYGELDEVEGYVPEISRTLSLAGIIVEGVQTVLNRRWKSGAREYKTGDAREHGNVKDLFAGFGIRALEAYAETERRDTAEKLLDIAIEDIPANGIVPNGWVRCNPDNLGAFTNAYASAHGMDGKALAKFAAAISAGDTELLKKLVGAAYAKLKANKMVRKEVVDELVRPLTDKVIRNKFVALADWLTKRHISGMLTLPMTWVNNMASNQLFKMMFMSQRALFAATVKVSGLMDPSMRTPEMKRAGKVAWREAVNIAKLLGPGQWSWTMPFSKASKQTDSWFLQKKISDTIPKEQFEGNTSLAGAVTSITEDQMTAKEHLAQASVGTAILTAVDYQGMDVRAKQALAYASYIAQAEVAMDEAVASGFKFANKAQKVAWLKNWLNNAPPEIGRQAHATAVAYAMDYDNVPRWMDTKSYSPLKAVLMRETVPFIKWPYNMARQMKRFGADSAIDVVVWAAGRFIGNAPGVRDTALGEKLRAVQSQRKASGAKIANSVAHLMTFTLMLAAMKALLSSADDKDETDRLGRSFDKAGARLDREWDTSSRVNITDVGILGKVVGAIAKMNGDDGSKDYWLRVRSIPYASPFLAIAATKSWLDSNPEEGKPDGTDDQALAAWREFAADFLSEGMLSQAINAARGNDSKYTAGQPLSTTLGGMATDLIASPLMPVPIMGVTRDLVDPQMRRTNPSQGLRYDPGFVEGVQSRIPGLSKKLPPKGEVVTRNFENALPELAKLKNEPNAKRTWVDPKSGSLKATFVNPDDKRDIPRWKTLLRAAGANVKPIDREGYKTALKGKEALADRRKWMKTTK